MIHDLKDLPAVFAAAPCSIGGAVRSFGAAALTLAVVGLEIWLRLPVRLVFNQMRSLEPTAPVQPHSLSTNDSPRSKP
jgi:hypothetical protein